VVATPIGNLGDITLRALDVLRGVDAIAAEDTRHSRALLDHFGIATRIFAVHEHNERAGAEGIVKLLNQGQAIALITDAGTPAVSDPGARVVNAVRAAGHDVVPIPGASALTTALSVAGIEDGAVTFAGFLPVKAGQRRTWLEALLHAEAATVCYESPHRILESLQDIHDVLGADRKLFICRELTKRFETLLAGTAAELLERVRDDADQQRGEFVLVIHGAPAKDDNLVEAERVLGILLAELPTRQAAALAAEITGRKKNELYDLALKLKS
jgi:16S rRNA (cytidine1402-2'-O)-methyltransferase